MEGFTFFLKKVPSRYRLATIKNRFHFNPFVAFLYLPEEYQHHKHHTRKARILFNRLFAVMSSVNPYSNLSQEDFETQICKVQEEISKFVDTIEERKKQLSEERLLIFLEKAKAMC